MDYSQESIVRFRKKLFKSVMRSEWERVKEIYRDHPEVRNAKITRSGNTALHIAVLGGEEKVVQDLVGLIPEDNNNALKVQNEDGDTPLHLAAVVGSVKMCRCIASRDPKMISVRNEENETPFFVAVLNGNKDAFLCLHQLCSAEEGYHYCRKIGGDSILHCAINGEFFDLAFQIIHHYGDLVNYVNEDGLSPLHVLANKPSVFSSGRNLGWFGKIIHACTFVEILEKQECIKETAPCPWYRVRNYEDEDKPIYPQNYQTCANFFRLFWRVFIAIFLRKKNSEREAESPSTALDKLEKKESIVEIATNNGRIDEHRCQVQERQIVPPTYDVSIDTIKFVFKALTIALGFGSRYIRKIQNKKKKHTWSVQIMKKLLDCSLAYEYDANGQEPTDQGTSLVRSLLWSDSRSPSLLQNLPGQNKQEEEKKTPEEKNKGTTNEKEKTEEKKEKAGKKETPILLAAKNGITEMVESILDHFPVAIHDTNSEKKNAVLLAAEYKQGRVYQLLDKRDILKDNIFHKVDKEGNSALHLAAKLGEHSPWLIPGAALQMQWEIKWYEFVKNSMPVHFFPRYNKLNQTAKDVFSADHTQLVKDGGEWLNKTSESCSLVAALIATVAFATASTVPGGVKQDSGTPTLENHTAFDVFAISSLVALCFSVTALVMFLAILTSRHQERDFRWNLPRKLLVGLTSLFVSIAAMLVSFCAGHFFVLKDKLKYAAFPLYAVTCLP
ncbi:hypothetical protein NMG60_11034797 [Bertholletia excelsa]